MRLTRTFLLFYFRTEEDQEVAIKRSKNLDFDLGRRVELVVKKLDYD